MKILNDPAIGVDENFISAINTHSAALADGDVVGYDFSSADDALINAAVPIATLLGGKIMGVVSDPSGNGIPVGENCNVMTKGLHKAVKKISTTMALGDQVGLSGTALMATKNASAAPAGCQLGYCAKAVTVAGDTTFYCRVDVK